MKYFAVWSFLTQINGHAVALREAYESGIDPFTVELNAQTAARGKKKTRGNPCRCLEWVSFVASTLHYPLHFSDSLLIPLVLAQKMGSDCTASAMKHRCIRIKQDGKRINDAISQGVDPLTLGIGSGEGTNSEPSDAPLLCNTSLHNSPLLPD